MESISIKGIIVAMIVAISIDIIGGITAVVIFSDSYTEEAILAIQGQTNVLVFALSVSFISTVVGGYICAHYGKLTPYKNAIIFGCLGTTLSAILATYEPMWFDIAGYITTIPAALLGSYLNIKKTHNNTFKRDAKQHAPLN